jgi:hypothetical protein
VRKCLDYWWSEVRRDAFLRAVASRLDGDEVDDGDLLLANETLGDLDMAIAS